MKLWRVAIAFGALWARPSFAQPSADRVNASMGEIKAVVDFFPKPCPMKKIMSLGVV